MTELNGDGIGERRYRDSTEAAAAILLGFITPALAPLNENGGNGRGSAAGDGNGDDGDGNCDEPEPFQPAGYRIPDEYRLEVEEDGSGCVIHVRRNANGQNQDAVTLVVIAHRPLIVSSMSRATDNSVWYTVKWLGTDGQVREEVMAASDIAGGAKLLQLSDLVVTKSTTNSAAKYLAELVSENSVWLEERCTRVATQLGWQGDGAGEFVFGPGRPCEVTDVKNAGPWLAGHCESGSLAAWVECACSLSHSRQAQAMIAGGFASVLLRLLKVPSFAIDSSGGSSGGKSIMLGLTAAEWGDPASVMQSWKDTGTAIEHYFAVVRGMPVFADETQLVRDPVQIENVIYGLTQGKSKARSRQDGSGLLPVTAWESVLMTTGEKPLTSFTGKSGVIPRVITMAGTPLASASEAAMVKDVSGSNFGQAGPAFVKHVLASSAAELQKRYQQLESELAAAAGDRIAARRASAVAVLKLASQLAMEAGLVLAGDGETWPWLVAGGGADDEGDGSMPRRALREALTWAQANAHRFIGHGEFIIQHQEVLGCWALDRGQPFISFVPATLAAFLRSQGYDAEAIRLAWRDEGWILSKDGKTSVPVHIQPGEKAKHVKVLLLEDIIAPEGTMPEDEAWVAPNGGSNRASWASRQAR